MARRVNPFEPHQSHATPSTQDAASEESRAWLEGQAALAAKCLDSAVPAAFARKWAAATSRSAAASADGTSWDGAAVRPPQFRGAGRAARLFWWRHGALHTRESLTAEPAVLVANDSDNPHDDAPLREGCSWPSADGAAVAYAVGTGASSAALRVRDVASRGGLDEDLPWHPFAGGVSWTPDGAGFFYARRRLDAADASEGLLHYHRLGSPAAADPQVLASGVTWHAVSEDGASLLARGRGRGGGREVVLAVPLAHFDSAAPGALDAAAAVLVPGPMLEGHQWHYVTTCAAGEHYFRTDWDGASRGGASRFHVVAVAPGGMAPQEGMAPPPTAPPPPAEDAPPASATPLPPPPPQPADDAPRWRVAVPEDEEGGAIAECRACARDWLVLRVTGREGAEVACKEQQLEVCTLRGGARTEVLLPDDAVRGPFAIGAIEARADNSAFFFTLTGLVDPGVTIRAVLHAGVDSDAPAMLSTSEFERATVPGLEPNKYVVEATTVKRPDGGDGGVPMYVLRALDSCMRGPAPCVLSCGGGLGRAVAPRFDLGRVLWAKHVGGAYAVACVRDGGRAEAVADLAAAARYLCEEGITTPGQLCARGDADEAAADEDGGGGATAVAAANLHPDLFAAAAAEGGAMDLLAHHCVGGARAQARRTAVWGAGPALRASSPLHTVAPDGPRVLLAPPRDAWAADAAQGHRRKLCAALQHHGRHGVLVGGGREAAVVAFIAGATGALWLRDEYS